MGNNKTTNLLPINATIHQKFSYLGNVVTNRNLVSINYKNIVLSNKKEKVKSFNISNLYKVRLDSVPIESNPAFWEYARKIPLQAREKDLLNQF